MTWLLYGAYGFTGRLIAREAVRQGERPLLAGRDTEALRALAAELVLEHRVFSLEDGPALFSALSEVDAVLHAAGPFSHTARPMAEACLATGTHYLDITGEIDVFEALHALDGRAREAGVALVPGVGFDVVPSDCAAAQAAALLPGATHIEIALHPGGRHSRGTARTVLEGLGAPPRERREGRIVVLPGPMVVTRIPFCDGTRTALAVPMGDVSTAYHSTGVPNVRVYLTVSRSRLRWLGAALFLRPLLAVPTVRRLLRLLVDRALKGPGEDELAKGESRVWCRASGPGGQAATVELVTPNGYTFTARSAVAAVQALRDGPAAAGRRGFLTPSLAFGPDFAERIPGVRRVMSRSFQTAPDTALPEG